MKISELINEIIRGKELYRYLPVSAGTACSILIMTWFFSSIFNIFHPYSVALSIEIGIIWTFFVLDKWTFKEGIKKHGTAKRFLQYHAVALAGLGVNEMMFLFLTYVINLYYLLAELLAILLAFSFNFILNKKLAWASYKKAN